ncbi:hypothetical protein RI367_004075 [Sorochytrium milnesiophthora]
MSSCALLITNLHLLGFPDRAQLTSPHVFARGSVNANQRLFESIVHFLLTRLDPARARRSFRLCYPCIDKDSAREFRNAVYKWLEEIKGDVPGEFFIRRSLLDECRGERFEGVLLSLSNLVLVAEMNGEALRQHPAFVACTPKQAVSTLSTEQESRVKAAVESEVQEYQDMMLQHSDRQQQWKLHADELTAEIATIKQHIADLHHHHTVLRRDAPHILSQHVPMQPDIARERIEQTLQEHAVLRQELLAVARESRRARQIVDGVATDAHQAPVIDGRALLQRLPLLAAKQQVRSLFASSVYLIDELRLTMHDAAQFCRSASHQLQEQQLYLRNLVELRGTIKAAEANARESVKSLQSQAQVQPLPADLALPPAVAMPVFAVAATAEDSITHPQRRMSFGMSLAHHKDTGELLQAMTIDLLDAEDDSMLL